MVTHSTTLNKYLHHIIIIEIWFTCKNAVKYLNIVLKIILTIIYNIYNT